MNKLYTRGLALLASLALCLSLAVGLAVPTEAATWKYNWGEREVVATELSQDALAFYTGSNTYSVLANLEGGRGTTGVLESPLYDALQELMASRQHTVTTYGDTREMYQYTDCENGGGAISSFYSGVAIGPAWDSGGTWNREHTWPNSKGEGKSENDIMMLRPTSTHENGSRSNKAYGESTGFYNPNSESNGTHDLRGDVSRIVLYVYVRWGGSFNQSHLWGKDGVIESLDVLLRWMEADPVDTWELGRNDSVQSITGTRNVFVDYPELSFLLFGEQVPEVMVTPSGIAMNGGAQEPPVTEPEPTPTEPAPTEPAPTEPAPTEPAPTEPAPTEPAPTEPAPTEPAPTEPAPTDPAPTDPAPTDPAPTDPAPTDPAPTDPAPTKPDSTQPQGENPNVGMVIGIGIAVLAALAGVAGFVFGRKK